MKGISMSNKIGIFLMVMLVVCAVLLLMPGADQPAAETTPVETTAPAAESTAAPTEPKVQISQPEAVGPTAPSGQPAPTTEPAAEPTPTTQPEAPTEPDGCNMEAELVRWVLDRAEMVETVVTPMTATAGLNALSGAAGCRGESYTYALVELAQERKMNPIAAFWELVSGKVYQKQKDDTGKMSVDAMAAPEQTAEKYPYTDAGVRQLLTELLALSARMEDGTALELALLGPDGVVEQEQVHFSESEGCRYAYFSCTSEQSTHILCFYLRSDARGEFIADVEFQLLNMRHATGDALTLAKMSECYDCQAAALMAAAELLMTGQSKAAKGDVPFVYEVGGWDAKIARFHFTAEAEQGTLTNYRLKIG